MDGWQRTLPCSASGPSPQAKGPGVILVFRPIDRIVRISLRTVAFDVPPQDIITRDNVTVSVNAVVYFRVIDPRVRVFHNSSIGNRL